MVPGEGLEPSLSNEKRILSPLRLPFRHPGIWISDNKVIYTYIDKNSTP